MSARLDGIYEYDHPPENHNPLPGEVENRLAVTYELPGRTVPPSSLESAHPDAVAHAFLNKRTGRAHGNDNQQHTELVEAAGGDRTEENINRGLITGVSRGSRNCIDFMDLQPCCHESPCAAANNPAMSLPGTTNGIREYRCGN